jgi:hypothetical protein
VSLSFENKNITKIAPRVYHSLLIKDGRPYSWGFNNVKKTFKI